MRRMGGCSEPSSPCFDGGGATPYGGLSEELGGHRECFSRVPPTRAAQQPRRKPPLSPDEGGAGPDQGEQQEEAAGAHGGDGAAGGGAEGSEAGGADAEEAATPLPLSRGCFCRQSGPSPRISGVS